MSSETATMNETITPVNLVIKPAECTTLKFIVEFKVETSESKVETSELNVSHLIPISIVLIPIYMLEKYMHKNCNNIIFIYNYYCK